MPVYIWEGFADTEEGFLQDEFSKTLVFLVIWGYAGGAEVQD